MGISTNTQDTEYEYKLKTGVSINRSPYGGVELGVVCKAEEEIVENCEDRSVFSFLTIFNYLSSNHYLLIHYGVRLLRGSVLWYRICFAPNSRVGHGGLFSALTSYTDN
jgi:hypothetical protein